MKKPISIRKKYRRKMIQKKRELRALRRIEKTDFLQWSPNTVNGVKQ